MSTQVIKLIVFIVLLVHGIGHIQGVVAGFGAKINNYNPTQSWLLKNQSERTNRVICLVLFLITAFIGIAAALSFRSIIFPESIWQTLTLITALLSSFCLIAFPNGFAMLFNKIGAIAVNLIIYYSILFRQYWPAEIFND
jgi:hypothetical protein